MRQRVEGILATGWQRLHCGLSVDELVSEQSRREDMLNKLQTAAPITNWDLVRASLTKLREKVER